MLTGSVPKLLQEASRIKEALEEMGDGLPEVVSIADLEAKITELEAAVSELDGVNAERIRLVNIKGDKAQLLSDYLVIIHLAIKAAFGPNSSEYEMVGGTRGSERKGARRKIWPEDQPPGGG